MTLIHIGKCKSNFSTEETLLTGKVLFKFKPEVSQEHKAEFVRQLEALKDLPCVYRCRLTVGGPSLTVPIERSKGFELALVSQHKDLRALEEYQASDEHHRYAQGTCTGELSANSFCRVTSTYLWPFRADVTRFDFEVPDAAGADWLE